jgi:hypothetical protein
MENTQPMEKHLIIHIHGLGDNRPDPSLALSMW